MELILADMAQVEKRLAKCTKDQKTFADEIEILNKVVLCAFPHSYNSRSIISSTRVCLQSLQP